MREDSVSLTPWTERAMFLKFLAYCNLAPPPPLNIPLAALLKPNKEEFSFSKFSKKAISL